MKGVDHFFIRGLAANGGLNIMFTKGIQEPSNPPSTNRTKKGSTLTSVLGLAGGLILLVFYTLATFAQPFHRAVAAIDPASSSIAKWTTPRSLSEKSASYTLYFTGLNLQPQLNPTIVLSNPQAHRVQVAIKPITAAGIVAATPQRVESLPAFETLRIVDSALIGTAAVQVDADAEISGELILESRDGKRREVIPGLKKAGSSLLLPNLLRGPVERSLVLHNTDDESFAIVEVICVGRDGREMDRKSIKPLSRLESRMIRLDKVFDKATMARCSVFNVNSTNEVVGFVLMGTEDGDVAALPSMVTSNSQLRFNIQTVAGPLALQSTIHLFNPGLVQASSVNAEIFDDTGASLGVVELGSLGPHVSLYFSPDSLPIKLPADPYSITVSAGIPISGYQLIRVANAAGISALSATEITDQRLVPSLTGSQGGAVLTVNETNTVQKEDGEGIINKGSSKQFSAQSTPRSLRYGLVRPPRKPESLTATVLNNSSIALYWHDTAENETSFKIERRQGNGAWQQIAIVPANQPSFSGNYYADTGVSGNNYSYRMRSSNAGGDSEYSNEATPVTVQVSTGFDFPVGDTEGTGSYIRNGTQQPCTELVDGKSWFVYSDVMAPGYTDHTGEDWNGACGGDTDRNQPVYAASLGQVVYAGYVPKAWGNVVLIAHRLPTGEVIYTQYAHLERIDVSVGTLVSRRQQIGTIGKGAANYSAHLHFEVRRVTAGAGNWPVATSIIKSQYFDPSDRSSDTWSDPGFVEGHRNLSADVSCEDTGEPNSLFEQANSLSCNATTRSKICSAIDVDYFKFTPANSGRATVTLTPPGNKDYELYIYTASHELIASSMAGTGAVETANFDVSAGQTYYIKVFGFASAFSTSDSYDLGLSCPSSTPAPTVTSFSINNGASSTTSTAVALNNSSSGGPTEYQASESSSFSGATWQPYSSAPGFSLSAGTGTKSVFFRVRNSAGAISASVSDTITLNAPTGVDNSQFVSDVTIPDDTQLSPGQTFTKTWRLKNTGTTNWSGYTLEVVSGSQMGASSSVAVPFTSAGSNVDVSVPMTAPTSAGTFQGNWKMRNAAGQFFGIEVWVRIVVVLPPTISWEFNTANNFEGWSCINIQAASVNNGNLFVDFAGADPYITGPAISASASSYRYVLMRMASNALDSNGKIYFKTAAENFYSEDKTISFFVSNCAVCGNASFLNYSIFVGGHSKWTGTITGIRVDPANNASSVVATDTVGWDYIRLSPTP